MNSSKLVFATSNTNKIKEINTMLSDVPLDVISMKQAGCEDDIVEDGHTLEENALIKARYLYKKLNCDVFAEDTGLEVDALDGRPGVHTARYGGASRDPIANMQKLLTELENKCDRNARFRTVMALIMDGKEYLFEGKVEGDIARDLSGAEGFGYDPIFIPKGYDKTFGELSGTVKNEISHRKNALTKMVEFLTKQKA